VDLRYAGIPGLRHKFRKLIAGAAGVIVANAELEARFSRINPTVLSLPTVPPPLPPGFRSGTAAEFTLVWIGTPVTFPFLCALRAALAQAARETDFRLLIVGGSAPLPGVKCELIPWSEAAELDALRRAHVGIMPLPDTPFARGKSAYKLIRYLQCGLPAIASPVGENRRVLRPGETGFLAENDAEWIAAVRALAAPETRSSLREALDREAAKYVLADAAAKLTAFLASRLNAGTSSRRQ